MIDRDVTIVAEEVVAGYLPGVDILTGVDFTLGTDLRLEPGTYNLVFATEDSHSFFARRMSSSTLRRSPASRASSIRERMPVETITRSQPPTRSLQFLDHV